MVNRWRRLPIPSGKASDGDVEALIAGLPFLDDVHVALCDKACKSLEERSVAVLETLVDVGMELEVRKAEFLAVCDKIVAGEVLSDDEERLFLSVARDGGIDDFCRHDGERLLMQGEYALRCDAGGDFLDLLLGEEDEDD